jgi:hypothetical protein
VKLSNTRRIRRALRERELKVKRVADFRNGKIGHCDWNVQRRRLHRADVAASL